MPDTKEHPQRTALVTGAAGFIGSHACARYIREGYSVVGVDNFDTVYDRAHKEANVQAVMAGAPAGAFELVEADIRDDDAMNDLYERTAPALTLHLAARGGVRPSIEQPALYSDINIRGSVVLLEAAQRFARTSPFLLASSSSIYGNNEKTPFAETDSVEAPISPYAATKRSCELIARTFHELYETPIACIRFFNVFGPRQRPDLAMAKFLRMISEGETIQMYGDGSTSRDYTYIDDILDGVIACGEKIKEHGYRIWNLGSDRPVKLSEMIAAVGRVVGKEPIIEQVPLPPGDVRQTCADLTRSEKELGYRPKANFDQALRTQAQAMPGLVLA